MRKILFSAFLVCFLVGFISANAAVWEENELSDIHEEEYAVENRDFSPLLRREKRNPLLFWSILRALIRSAFRRVVSRSGARVTIQYFVRRGGWNAALRDFNNMRLTSVKATKNGFTGVSGQYRVTIYRRSSGGYPTMVIQGGNRVRKFRYE